MNTSFFSPGASSPIIQHTRPMEEHYPLLINEFPSSGLNFRACLNDRESGLYGLFQAGTKARLEVLEKRLEASEMKWEEQGRQQENFRQQNLYQGKKLEHVEHMLNRVQSEIAAIREANVLLERDLRKELTIHQGNIQHQKQVFSLLQNDLQQIQSGLYEVQSAAKAHSLKLQLQQQSHAQDMAGLMQMQASLSEQIRQVEMDASNMGLIMMSFGILILIAAVAGCVFLRKRGKQVCLRLRKWQHTSRLKCRTEMLELVSKYIRTERQNTSVSAEAVPNHAPMLKFANEISRMEMNMARMDPSVKGFKQMSRGLERIRNNLAASGYEMVPMLGHLYQDGLRVDADFIVDESLPEGERRITAVSRPQVNYKGVLIQRAAITVSQNI